MTAVAERGRLVIAARVVERIAGQAAGEVPAVGGHTGGMLGIGGRGDPDARPRASVQLTGRTAVVRVAVGIVYPAVLRTVCDDIRHRVIDQVGRLTGVEVRRVDIEIAWLPLAGDLPVRRVELA